MRTFLIISLLPLSSFAQEGSILGYWKYKESKCSSGVPYNTNSKDISISLDMVIEITESKLFASMPVSFKAKEGYYEETKASIQQGIERLRKLPQTEEIKQSLKKIDETLALVKTYEQGVNCTVNFVSDISVEGNILTSGPRIIQSSNCPGNQSKPTQQVDRSEFLVEGRTLTVKSLKPTDRDNQACPKGDNVTTILERF